MHLSCNLDIYQKIALQKSKTPFGCNWKKHVLPSTMHLWHTDKDELTITLLEEKKYHLINFLCFQIGGLHISFLFIGKWNDFHIVSTGNFKKKIFKIWTMSGDDYSSWSEKFRWTTQEQQLNSFFLRSYNLQFTVRNSCTSSGLTNKNNMPYIYSSVCTSAFLFNSIFLQTYMYH